jgi:O-antigen ligase
VRLDEGRDLNHKGTGGNPHQEFLLWGVHLGIPGMALLAAFFVALVHDARRMAMPVRRSLLSMIAVLFVACLFNSVLYDALIGDFFCIVLAALFVLGARQPNAEHTAIAS